MSGTSKWSGGYMWGGMSGFLTLKSVTGHLSRSSISSVSVAFRMELLLAGVSGRGLLGLARSSTMAALTDSPLPGSSAGVSVVGLGLEVAYSSKSGHDC